ncbi:FBD-associated F-box protein At5g56370-like [Rhododendron vialii]|uniref:FBD-associated F-box protein At5g56370-like n=1 Tax=Rhododendron vialii TaxID=182163 RepID=UPI00265F50C8|nr:FBD-associated F-box protein At5g56370-like [Rhododendron vialii]
MSTRSTESGSDSGSSRSHDSDDDDNVESESYDSDHHGRLSDNDSTPVDGPSGHLSDEPSPKWRDGKIKITTVDRISDLTDHLLVHILSFLPIGNAIKTQVPSKRWQFLWTCLPSLHFRSCCRDLADFAAFVTFVEKTLILCNCSKLKKFRVDCDSNYVPDFEPNVSLWTRFAVGKGTEELHLHFDDTDNDMSAECRYRLPQLLFTNASFKVLHFCLCSTAVWCPKELLPGIR